MTAKPTAAEWWAGQVVLVTGASGLIGRGCVETFLEAGARVAAVDRAAPTELDASVLAIEADLLFDEEIERTFEAVESALGPPATVVQCAALHGRTPFLELTGAMIDAILATNVRVTMMVGRTAASVMRRHGLRGSIVNLSSTSGVLATAASVPYEASKGAVNMATKGMAVALAPDGIRVNAVAPGSMVKSQEIDRVRDPHDLSALERTRIPLGRLGVASDIAQAALFLASPSAAYVTGTVIYVDGGQAGTYATVTPAD